MKVDQRRHGSYATSTSSESLVLELYQATICSTLPYRTNGMVKSTILTALTWHGGSSRITTN